MQWALSWYPCGKSAENNQLLKLRDLSGFLPICGNVIDKRVFTAAGTAENDQTFQIINRFGGFQVLKKGLIRLL